MTSVGSKMWRRSAATAALMCALVASMAVGVAPAAAEEGDSAPLRPMSEGGYYFPDITGPTVPEEYPFEMELGEEQELRQVDEHEVAVYYSYGIRSFSLTAELAHDADGTNVPTTLRVTTEDVVTLTVHYREGNPAAGGAPFVFPITPGMGWEGGFRTIVVPMNNPTPPVEAPPTSAPEPACSVPHLHGLSLRAAKAQLRAANCAIGEVRLAAGATPGKGKVVKQFRFAGAELPAGAPVPVKLGMYRSRHT